MHRARSPTRPYSRAPELWRYAATSISLPQRTLSDPEPINWDEVVAIQAVTDGSDPPTFHVRDQERRYAALAACDLPAADRGALTPTRLAALPATVWLPAPGAAEPMEVPEPAGGSAWQGWEWPSGASLLLDVDRDPLLPGLRALAGGLPGSQRAVVAGRPVRVDRRDPDETGRDFGGWVHGFLTDQIRIYAAVGAPSAAERDALLSAALTLTPDPEGPEARGAFAPAA